MPYSVEVLLDSISETGDRLTTFVLEYPRFIHAEMLTHRAFSRNAASSRAIPIEKMIQKVQDDPAMPLYWGSNRAGMQAGAEVSQPFRNAARQRWLQARDAAVAVATDLSSFGVHKQIANRVLEPFSFITVVLSGTTFENFFQQRANPAAQPEMQHIAFETQRKYARSKPTLRLAGEWHMPFLRPSDTELSLDDRKRVSVARCARVSYLNHDGIRSVNDDLRLADKLMLATPPHFSPAEHVATPGRGTGNFTGFNQLRAEWEHDRY